MSIEAATYVADLQALNPPSTDPRSQGDDHLRLIKQVLQNTFGGASRQFQIPSAITIATSTAVTKANGESILYVSTAGGAVTLTLPALVALDAGWKVRIIKTTSDANPIFITPPSGTINSGGVAGLAKARRCIPGISCEAIWDGTNWFATRVTALPIGCVITYNGSALPAGYEWPNGQTLASVATNYPEYNAAVGSGATPDYRGRAAVCVDSLGGLDAARLNVTGCSLAGVRNTVGGGGGAAASTLAPTNLPPYTPAGTVASTTIGTVTGLSTSPNQVGTLSGFTDVILGGTAITPSISASTTSTFTGTAAPGQNSTAFDNAQPSVMCAKLLVVE